MGQMYISDQNDNLYELNREEQYANINSTVTINENNSLRLRTLCIIGLRATTIQEGILLK